MNGGGVWCPDNTKYQILTMYVLKIYQITYHNKYKNILADAFIHRKIDVICPYSAWEANRRPREPALHTCYYRHALHTCIYICAITLDVKYAFHFNFLGYRFNLLIICKDLCNCNETSDSPRH